MLKDYLIIGWLTIIVAWPWSLSVLGILLGIAVWRRRWWLAALSALLLALVATAAWEFAYWMG
ncbi:hypothetical protein [Shimwellia blattae]|uniref:Uncharacterized protein n=1 Tax=Shimwellia blattae (strain ATCC 29907 / DSM 4481 / JCM 1650 / NBRC 105725 / CDC 9005-74) TaxID=630626 RepID=I2B9B9_SHIBC|nr:hypothetical protein [Shimwellia blattae]AFJ47123.1 hypothetical protein EBL_c20320 [Shimwellia blattae DSM 4481 = NBRC 105725]GAB80755.1 hypothetical protein EB105725_08_00400 [Shimwellia blattae DSM 4481 = NBRC 105725]VDY64618.1 Uncharacterised protein [Shimwellia blattae]VEC22725.1 Uncharacterised protein [Shimwellia blattae]